MLLIGFALTDGFDLGVATILPFVVKGDDERRLVINSVSATSEGNQVWFILGGGAIFAASPFVYGVSSTAATRVSPGLSTSSRISAWPFRSRSSKTFRCASPMPMA